MDLDEHEEPRLKKVKCNIADTDQANGLDEVIKNISPSNQTKASGPGMNNSSESVGAKSDFDPGSIYSLQTFTFVPGSNHMLDSLNTHTLPFHEHPERVLVVVSLQSQFNS
ncbi:hypothetical protein LIER_04879 [Lithospermum erythrorhizon]|uniref:Uncharacterized protein n=1 Tax=Lithospermum erythrorhizon TaxID=34254 RepID=A0AAV3NZN7_LITER